jgi:hypothetical protein
LLAGEYPGGFGDENTRRRMDAFLETGFNTFINLTHYDEQPDYAPILLEEAGYYGKEVRVLHLPIQDFSLPTLESMTATLNAIDAALAEGRNVYVHCWAGVGRTGTVVGCYLVRHGMTGEQALAQIAEWWKDDPRRARFKRSPETDEQMEFIRDWKSGIK